MEKALTAKPATSAPAGVLKRGNAYNIDARLIGRKRGWNPRFDFGEIEQLAKSLAINGMLNPIRVKRTPKPLALVQGENGIYVLDETKDGGYLFELIDGDRRLTALELLMKQGKYDRAFPDGIPAIIVDKGQDSMTSLVQMFEANNGKHLLPLEEAAAFKAMKDGFPEEGIKGFTIKQICEVVGHRHVHIIAMLALLDADEDVKSAVKDGTINKTQAKNIAIHARGDKSKQKELVSTAKAAGQSREGKRKLAADIEKSRIAKAGKQGRVLKMKAMKEAELSTMGTKVAEALATRLKRLGIKLTDDLDAWIKKDAELAAAYTYGALAGLRAAAGQSEKLIMDAE